MAGHLPEGTDLFLLPYGKVRDAWHFLLFSMGINMQKFKDCNIGFIGAGRMASALIAGLIAQNIPPARIKASCPGEARLAKLHKTYGIQVSCDNQKIAAFADILMLAVKPTVGICVLKALSDTILTHKPIIVSLMAGVKTATLCEALNKQIMPLRAMPHTPAAICSGISALYAPPGCHTNHHYIVQTLFQHFGDVIWCQDESQMNAITALSGSGPAYFFRFMQALEQAGRQLGLDEVSRKFVLQTALGSAKIALLSQKPLDALCKDVAPPGGGTACALEIFERGDLNHLVQEAVQAAKLHYDSLA